MMSGRLAKSRQEKPVANKAVSALIYCKTDSGWKRYKPAPSDNNHGWIQGVASVDGARLKFETFTYQLRTYEGKKTKFRTVGPNAKKAYNEFVITQGKRTTGKAAEAKGLTVTDPSTESRVTIADAVKRYIERSSKRTTGRTRTSESYAVSLLRFQESARKLVYLDEVNEDALLAFHAYLRKKYRNAEGTIALRHTHVKSLLIAHGFAGGQEMRKKIGKIPKVDKKVVVVYDRDQLSTLFAHLEDAGDSYLWTVLKILLMTGLRDQEAGHLQWTDIDFKRGLIRVTGKPDLGYRLKDREERVIPLHPDLAAILQERRKAVPKARFVVGAKRSGDAPGSNWLHMLKRAVREANVECGSCKGCRTAADTGRDPRVWFVRNTCRLWKLHRFRSTYATTLFRQGYLLTEIQALLGHSDIKTTMSYIAKEKFEVSQERMKSIVFA
jgi:integrase